MAKSGTSLEDEAKIFVEDGIPGDISNSILGFGMQLIDPEDWSRMSPLATYENYFRKRKFEWNLPFAEAVINASDQERVKKYNEIVARINTEFGDGIRNKQQVEVIQLMLDELYAVVERR